MSAPVPELPVEIGYSTFHGTFVRAAADGPDSGSRPDATAPSGVVRFTPSVDRLRAVLSQSVVWLEPAYVATVGPGGTFTIDVPATDSTDVSPTGWSYGVSVELVGRKPWTFNVSAPVGAVQNIINAAQFPTAAPGVVVTQGSTGPAGPGVEAAAAVDDELVLTLDNGVSLPPVPLPPGPQGDQGPQGNPGSAILGGIMARMDVGGLWALVGLGAFRKTSSRPVGASPENMNLMPVTLGYAAVATAFKVSITAGTTDGQARFAIYDTGPGATPSALLWQSPVVEATAAAAHTFDVSADPVALPAGPIWVCASVSSGVVTYDGFDYGAIAGDNGLARPRGYAGYLRYLPNIMLNGFPEVLSSPRLSDGWDGPDGAPIIHAQFSQVGVTG